MSALPKFVDHGRPAESTPQAILELRGWARGYLASCRILEIHEAVDELWRYAETSGLIAELGADACQALIAREFEAGYA